MDQSTRDALITLLEARSHQPPERVADVPGLGTWLNALQPQLVRVAPSTGGATLAALLDIAVDVFAAWRVARGVTLARRAGDQNDLDIPPLVQASGVAARLRLLKAGEARETISPATVEAQPVTALERLRQARAQDQPPLMARWLTAHQDLVRDALRETQGWEPLAHALRMPPVSLRTWASGSGIRLRDLQATEIRGPEKPTFVIHLSPPQFEALKEEPVMSNTAVPQPTNGHAAMASLEPAPATVAVAEPPARVKWAPSQPCAYCHEQVPMPPPSEPNWRRGQVMALHVKHCSQGPPQRGQRKSLAASGDMGRITADVVLGSMVEQGLEVMQTELLTFLHEASRTPGEIEAWMGGFRRGWRRGQ